MASVVWIEPVPAPDLKQQLLGNLKEGHVQQTFISCEHRRSKLGLSNKTMKHRYRYNCDANFFVPNKVDKMID
jgi:hypothetical protein